MACHGKSNMLAVWLSCSATMTYDGVLYYTLPHRMSWLALRMSFGIAAGQSFCILFSLVLIERKAPAISFKKIKS